MTTKLQSLTELWQEFNLTGTQSLLDELATEITSRYIICNATYIFYCWDFELVINFSIFPGKTRVIRARNSLLSSSGRSRRIIRTKQDHWWPLSSSISKMKLTISQKGARLPKRHSLTFTRNSLTLLTQFQHWSIVWKI